MRSRRHRWVERIVAFGGLIYWLVGTYFSVAFALALATTLTVPSVIREIALFWLVVSGFAALAAHRWRPRLTRLVHWTMVAFAALYMGTCVEFVEFPPTYVSFDYRGVHVEYADEFQGVARDQSTIRNVIDQLYSRSNLAEPKSPVRVRFITAGSGKPIRFGPGTTDPAGADVVLSTDRGGLRETSFPLEGSFLIAERLVHRQSPSTQQSIANGFAYWTMLGIKPQPEWAVGWLTGRYHPACSDLNRTPVGGAPDGELTIWWADSQRALHLESAPFVDAERGGDATAARDLFARVAASDDRTWRAMLQQHCV